MKERLTIALPKGRLLDGALGLMRELGVEGVDSTRQDHRRGFHTVQGDITAGAWAELGGLVDQLCCGQGTQLCAQVVGRGEHQVAELDDRADPCRAC